MLRDSILKELGRVSAWRQRIQEDNILEQIFYSQTTATREQLIKALVTLENIEIVPFHKLRPDWNPFSDISIIHPTFPVAAAAFTAKILVQNKARPTDFITRADFYDLMWNCPAIIAAIDALQDWEQGF
jgi:hypothetical protein